MAKKTGQKRKTTKKKVTSLTKSKKACPLGSWGATPNKGGFTNDTLTKQTQNPVKALSEKGRKLGGKTIQMKKKLPRGSSSVGFG